MYLWINATETNSWPDEFWRKHFSADLSLKKWSAERPSAFRRLQTMWPCVEESRLGRMLCLEGETFPQSGIVKNQRDPPAALKATFVPFWKPSSGGHFVWKHHSRPCLRFLWKTTREALCVCVHVCQRASVSIGPVAPQFATPSMCVSGEEAPQLWDYLSWALHGQDYWLRLFICYKMLCCSSSSF